MLWCATVLIQAVTLWRAAIGFMAIIVLCHLLLFLRRRHLIIPLSAYAFTSQIIPLLYFKKGKREIGKLFYLISIYFSIFYI